MKQCPGLLKKILPPPRGNFMIRADLDRGYKRFSRGLSLILTVSVLVPMTVIAVLSHYQHRQLFEQEEQEQLFLHLKLGSAAVEKFIAELETVVRIIAMEDGYQQLSNQSELAEVFFRLQNEYPGFEEIEVIDEYGRGQARFGQNHGTTSDYLSDPWYRETLRKERYISNTFIWCDDEPHFFIAVGRKFSGREKNWVVRVTFNAQELQKLINKVHTGYSEKLFLVDTNFRSLTDSGKYGIINKRHIPVEPEIAVQEPILSNPVSLAASADMQITRHSVQGQQVIRAVTDLHNTSWKLVLIKEEYLYGKTWIKFKAQLTAIFIFCAGLALLFVVEISRAITCHLREAGLKREQFLARAEQPNKLASIGRLAAGVAHEINNPLAIINQKAGLVQDFMELSDDFEPKTGMTEALEGIQSNVQRCKVITHRLLGFAHQTEVKIEKVNINILLREVVDFLAEEASYNRIRIVFDLGKEICPIFSDRGELQQIFLNITGNAIDAVGSDGQVTLSSRQLTSETVRIVINDNGTGMSKEVQAQIFDPFFTTKETGRGTGLGLSIVYGLVRKLGGSINVVSAVNEGAAFEIDLPVEQEEE